MRTGWFKQLELNGFFWVALSFEAVLGLVAMVIDRLIAGHWMTHEWTWSLESIGQAGAALVLPLSFAFIAFSDWGVQRSGLKRIFRHLEELMGPSIRRLGPFSLILLAGAAGWGEELLFRGLIQDWAGLWLTSLLFGLLHAMTPTYFLIATLMGLYLGALYQFCGNLVPPILVHWIYDAAALLLLRKQLLSEDASQA